MIPSPAPAGAWYSSEAKIGRENAHEAGKEDMAESVSYDADDASNIRKRLKEVKINLIVPHRKNRKKPKIQAGRKLRRYRKRWKIERTFAWLGNYRRLIVRHEQQIETYRALFHLACILIVLNRF